eukprot:CAMPEP_0115377732 /NCGR_PEP_ID=MMETSP0271-20121206/3641_1 /TAXON_ID=71861 /ORGANISM="Scrippsiella trochoidea, Strain CCMP3099" /LENGTH=33 /DNA_ID= /DNA_START= /DNA_END= /DNA_ORIENTATION=
MKARPASCRKERSIHEAMATSTLIKVARIARRM